VDLYADDKLTNSRSHCHVYSVPYHFDNFMFMTSRFQDGIFNKVRLLIMLDVRPFENDLFKIISQDFPFLQRSSINNRKSQKKIRNLRLHLSHFLIYINSILGAHISTMPYDFFWIKTLLADFRCLATRKTILSKCLFSTCIQKA
jgi:hypothetical protein